MLDKIKNIICNFVDITPEEITEESKLLSDIGMCSFDLAMLSVEIENEFGVSVSAKDFASVKTVGGLTEFISAQQK